MSNYKNNKSKTYNKSDCTEYKSVSELNTSIKQILEKPYDNIKVCGEISNFKISNKNLFATLKDGESSINIVSWGYSYKKNPITIINGDSVIIYGKIVHYTKSGNYCLLANKFEKIGIGNCLQEYEDLKKKYDEMGYFTNKKKFPQQLERIGISTALEGAALQDILYVLRNNNYFGKIIIKGCLVQGNSAPQSIAESINSLSKWQDNNKKLDLIIIARGGGSFDDLIAFSSSTVIEAIHNCNIFTISAVGHEIDFMLSDFVADMRAPTPSVSGEIITSFQKNLNVMYEKIKLFTENQMRQTIATKLNSYKAKIALLLKSVIDPEIRLCKNEMQLDQMKKQICNTLKSNLLTIKNKLDKLSVTLQKYDIQNMMKQGYVILTKNNRIVDSINDVKIGQKLKLKMRDGDVNIIIAD